MFRIEKLKDTSRRSIKYNKFHRKVPLFVRCGTAMEANRLVDQEGWWRIVFATGGFIQVHQIMAAVKAVQKVVKQGYQKVDVIELKVHKPITGLSKKSAGSRMGRGKGPAVIWGFNVQAGETLVRISTCIAPRVAFAAFQRAKRRLTHKLLFV